MTPSARFRRKNAPKKMTTMKYTTDHPDVASMHMYMICGEGAAVQPRAAPQACGPGSHRVPSLQRNELEDGEGGPYDVVKGRHAKVWVLSEVPAQLGFRTEPSAPHLRSLGANLRWETVSRGPGKPRPRARHVTCSSSATVKFPGGSGSKQRKRRTPLNTLTPRIPKTVKRNRSISITFPAPPPRTGAQIAVRSRGAPSGRRPCEAHSPIIGIDLIMVPTSSRVPLKMNIARRGRSTRTIRRAERFWLRLGIKLRGQGGC